MPKLATDIGKCSGCFACFNICPCEAIEMKVSQEGFYIPIIDKAKCDECGKCEKICPVLSQSKLERFPKPVVYASWSKDERIRMTSSSGGVFTELAKTILERNGVVYGVVWNDEFLPVHQRGTRIEDVEKMKGSKYSPSRVGRSYQMVLKDLDEGRPVLFSGTPCQVAAVNKIVGENPMLYTVDIICHGVPSLLFFKKYLQYLAKDKKIKYINMRDKAKGWSNYQVKIEFESGVSYLSSHRKDIFFLGFLLDLFLNEICYDCPFAKIPRQGDITLGDFWGAPKKLRDEKGVSVLLVNGKKGEELLNLTKNLELIPSTINVATKGNPRIVLGKLKKPKKRDKMIKVLNENEFEEIVKILKTERIKRTPNRVVHIIVKKLKCSL